MKVGFLRVGEGSKKYKGKNGPVLYTWVVTSNYTNVDFLLKN
jgi:hypothetical protein